jgi:phage tail sheath protein FI
MPVTVTYPGVYIEEVPSGVRSIAGVATSITAFAGWTARGDTDRATLVQSWAAFERSFGGLDARNKFAHSVYHFFNNGGQQALIIRIVAADAGTATVAVGATLQVTARNQGDWAKNYAIITRRRTDDPTNTRFSMRVAYVPPNVTPRQEIVVESYDDLSIQPNDRRFVVRVLEEESSLVRTALIGNPANSPPDTAVPSPNLAGSANLDGTVLQPNVGAFETALTAAGAGVNLLDRVDLFNILCVPGETNPPIVQQLQGFCRTRRAFLIVDCDQGANFNGLQNGPNNALTVDDGINAAFYFPWIRAPDPLRENRNDEYPPCGFIAGLYAKTDATRGVWKAPAGTDASLVGASGLRTVLTDLENGTLNTRAVNCLRNFRTYGNVVWGARTLRGNNDVGSEWKYVPVRRTALFIEESLYRGTQWVVFEPNDEPLWAQIRLNVGAFMQDLFRQGAFQGKTPRDAYFVRCDGQTTTQSDINLGIVNIHVGFAPLKPAEFVVIRIQQIAGQIQA